MEVSDFTSSYSRAFLADRRKHWDWGASECFVKGTGRVEGGAGRGQGSGLLIITAHNQKRLLFPRGKRTLKEL